MTDQTLPDKPSWLAEDEYNYILDRDQRRCVFYGRCPRAGGAAACDTALDFDHGQPRELGGDDSFGNVRLLCASYNRGRPLEPLQKWAQRNYFDGAVRPGALRHIQRIAGWDAIEAIEPTISDKQSLRRVLLAGTTYLPGATGTGKLILAISVMFKLNQIVGAGFPRVKNVLWLTHDTTLRDAGVRWVRKNIPAEVRDAYLDDLAKGHVPTTHAVQKLLHDEQAINYQPPARLRRLIGTKESGDLGVLNELANELYGQLMGSGHKCSIGEVIKATIVAARTVFGFKKDDDARNGGPLDLPAYHVAALTRYRSELQKIAYGNLVRWGVLGEAHRRFGG
jgi:hypothetical protein